MRFAVTIAATLISAFFLASHVMAEEFVISGNGASSVNQVSATVTVSATVEQVNQGSIQNDVKEDLNTGGNNVSENTGTGTQITTGDITTKTTIENSTNSSTASLDCCAEQSTAVTITGNGADSQNTVDFNRNSGTEINIDQNDEIKNNVAGNANTGGNSANNNSGGNVSIETGDINAVSKIENGSVNTASVSAPRTAGGNVDIKISGNGSSSDNSVYVSLNNNFAVNTNDRAKILNDDIWDLITGNNQANGNTGGYASIITGDINFITEIINDPVNTNKVVIDCCEDQGSGNPPPPPPPPSPPVNPDLGSSTPPTGGDGGQVLGAAAGGQILPATGVSWTLILSLVSLIMFILGLYLRLHPGVDPGGK